VGRRRRDGYKREHTWVYSKGMEKGRTWGKDIGIRSVKRGEYGRVGCKTGAEDATVKKKGKVVRSGESKEHLKKKPLGEDSRLFFNLEDLRAHRI